MASLTPRKGVYVLCDLDNVPVYVGKSADGIRSRVQRHLTSARSDVVANRQVDVWEVAFVWEYPEENADKRGELEARLFHRFNPKSALMNGTIPPRPRGRITIPTPRKVQVMEDAEIAEKKGIDLRLARQAQHYAQVVGHFLAVKNSDQIARAMDAHFKRLAQYHQMLLRLSTKEELS